MVDAPEALAPRATMRRVLIRIRLDFNELRLSLQRHWRGERSPHVHRSLGRLPAFSRDAMMKLITFLQDLAAVTEMIR